MMIHDITKLVGSHKRRKRVGRGPSSGHGKASGRGTKGAGSRSGFGGSIPAISEGGQVRYYRRVPKVGFSNARFTRRFAVVNTGALEARFPVGAEVNAQVLAEAGLIPDAGSPVKILGTGQLTKKLTVRAASFSASAKQKIEAAGGTCQAA